MVKSEKEALRCRQEGNKQYSKKQFDKALESYNESIRSCQFGDCHYFYAMGNKSALLFETKQFQKCKDIINFIHTVDTFSELFGSDKKFMAKIRNRLSSCDGQLTLSSDEGVESREPTAAEMEPEKYSSYPFINHSITTKNISSFGCSVVASKTLKPNEMLFCVKPFTAVLGSPFWTSHCYNCFKYVKDSVIVPCNGCSEVSFCSVSCQEEHIIHKSYECSHIGFLKEVGLFHLGVSILLKFHIHGKLHEIINIYNRNRKDVPHKLSFSSSDIEFGIVNLCSSLTVTQSFLKNNLHILQAIFDKLFCDSSFDNLTSDIFVRTLSAISCQMMMNASTVVFYDKNSSCNKAIGSGIYPEIAKMNHSCHSNTVCLFDGTTATVKTTQNVIAGSQLFNSYGYDFESLDRNVRQSHLKAQYDFNCCCTACVLDWKRNEYLRVIVCQTCSSTMYLSSTDEKCSKCSSEVTNKIKHDVKMLEETYSEAFQCYQRKEYQKGIHILTCSESVARIKILSMPDCLLLDWYDLVKKFIVLDFNERL